jgi:hypothetical protein
MNYLLSGVLTVLVAASPASADRTVSKTLPVAADGRVVIDTYKGSIRVTAWDRPEVAVEARIVPDDSCGSERDQREWVAATRVVIEPDGTGVRIKSDYDDLESSWGFLHLCTSRPFVHYKISLPRAADLKIHDYKSDTDVKDFAGRLKLDTYKGSAVLAGLSGPFDLKTYKGQIRARFTRLSGDVHAETYKGEVTLTIPADAAFELSADSGSKGEIDSDFETTGPARAYRRSGRRASASVNGGGPHVALSTEKGRLSIRRG